MKGLRATIVVALVVIGALLPASSAGAEVHGTSFASPRAGNVVTSPRVLEVAVDWSGQRPEHVDVRLVGADGDALDGTETVRLADCRGDCQDFSLSSREAVFSGARLDPATLAPFAAGLPRCNGAYGLQARPEGEAWGAGIGFVAQSPPSAATDVTAASGTRRATISWTAAPEPDVVGYTVQRREGPSGTWSTVTEVGPDTTSVTDRDAPAGQLEYRVTTFRGDGFVGDEPVAACVDDERDLATAAPPVATTVASEDGAPTDAGSTTPDDERTGAADDDATPDDDATSGETGDGDGTSSTDGGQDDQQAAGDDTGDDAAAPQPSSSRRRAPSTSVESSPRNEVSVPSLDSREAPDGGTATEQDDDEFSRELDFGELGTGGGGDDEVAGEVGLGVPGGFAGGIEERLALRRVLGPTAGGMILLAFGLHLRRWLRDAIE